MSQHLTRKGFWRPCTDLGTPWEPHRSRQGHMLGTRACMLHYPPTPRGHVAGLSPLETPIHCCRTRWSLFANVCGGINCMIGNQRPEDGGFVAMFSNGQWSDREVSVAAWRGSTVCKPNKWKHRVREGHALCANAHKSLMSRADGGGSSSSSNA